MQYSLQILPPCCLHLPGEMCLWAKAPGRTSPCCLGNRTLKLLSPAHSGRQIMALRSRKACLKSSSVCWPLPVTEAYRNFQQNIKFLTTESRIRFRNKKIGQQAWFPYSWLSRLRDFLSCLAPLKSLEHTLVALEPLPSALCLLTCSQKSTIKFSAPSPLASFPRSKKKLSKTWTPKISIYFFIPCGLPAISFICLACYSNGILSGSDPHPWGLLTGFDKVTLLIEAHLKTWQHSVLQTPQTNSSQLLLKTVPDKFSLTAFCSHHLPVTLTSNSTSLWFTSMQVNWPHSEEGANLQGDFRKAGTPVSHW